MVGLRASASHVAIASAMLLPSPLLCPQVSVRPEKLPELGKGLAEGIRGFKDSLKGSPQEPATPPSEVRQP
ncbi:MAG TPA: twin-arginine translocase TatA/TatE family subunit [Bryobacteraceae bacterium]|jgi:hypothetical protein